MFSRPSATEASSVSSDTSSPSKSVVTAFSSRYQFAPDSDEEQENVSTSVLFKTALDFNDTGMCFDFVYITRCS